MNVLRFALASTLFAGSIVLADPATPTTRDTHPHLHPATRPATEATPTLAEAKQFFDDQKYKEAIRDVAKITAAHEWQAKKPDGFELLTIKAESHLRLKEGTIAATTFEAAAKLAPDPASAGLSRATAYLIKHSIGLHYVPKATANKHVVGGKPDDQITVDIVDPDKRKDAFTALWQDQKDLANPKLEPATTTENHSIQAVLDAAPLVVALRDYDFAAHGNDDETKAMATTMADHSKELLAAMVEKLGIRVDAISTKAMTVYNLKVPTAGGTIDVWHKKGMDNAEPKEIADAVSTTAKVLIATKILADNLNTAKDYYARIEKDATRIHDKADAVQKEDYLATYYNYHDAMK